MRISPTKTLPRSERLAQRKARYAELIDHFHLTPAQIGELTERQIVEMYYHAREKDTGQVKRPAASAPDLTEEEHVRAYLRAVARLGQKRPPQDAVLRMVERIREAHRKKRQKGEGHAQS